MKISAYHKALGDNVEWAMEGLFAKKYDKIYSSKIFTFSTDFDYSQIISNDVEKGGTGYDIKKKLPDEIEKSVLMDYSLYPIYPFSIQFFSRGCIRHCPFCLVHDKEGDIYPTEPVALNPNGKWIEVLDNNFFANPQWHEAIDYLIKQKQPVNFHGIDIRIMTEEQAFYLKKLKLKQNIHIAWDLPQIDLTEKLKEITKWIKPNNITCYILIGFNSTIQEDLRRLNTLKKIGIIPFVQPYRDFTNNRIPDQYELDIARWANRTELFKSMDFGDYSPRKGFKCKQYINN